MRHIFWMKAHKTPSQLKLVASYSPQQKLRVMGWVTLLLQLLFPLSLSFTPAIAASISPAATGNIVEVNIATETYILKTNESVGTLSKKYGLSVDEIKKINHHRIFSKPFTALTAGDEIDIPRQRSPFSVDNNSVKSAETKIARYVADRAPLLSDENTAKSVQQMARSTANNELNRSAQQWLSQFGTAKVQINVNNDFKLDGSAADVLLPLADGQKSLLFTQLGARNKNSRNTVNVGVGVRTFQNNWMYGMNTFLDNDITGKNRRVGLGAEAWTDYLKLSANSYFALTDWHQSRDFSDDNERPANGYDIRAEAYLPSHPQLGGKLMYEKYRGDDVALFGKDERQKNPDAITAGVNYTPIPLVTIGVEHRAGKGSHNDSSFNLQLNYRLGESWQSQINSSAVASTRQLASSRYDLVERNNNIVLDYQKQDVISLSLPEQISGDAGTRVAVSAQVSSKHALDRIEWDDAALSAVGGSLSMTSLQSVEIKLPPYQLTSPGSNTYVLGAVAYDKQGNVSRPVTMQVTVLAGSVSITAANLTVTSDNAPANNTATNSVQAIVTDAGGNPVTGQSVTFSTNNGASVTTVIGTTGANGIATATLTNSTVGTTAVTATVNGTSTTVNTQFIADSHTATITAANLRVTADNAPANNTATNSVQAIVTDAGGNPVAGQNVTFSANNGARVTAVIGTTGADGIATATLTNSTAGETIVIATVNGTSTTVNTQFIADSHTATITAANLRVTADNAPANNTATNSVQAIVTDAGGNPVTGQSVTFSANNGASVTTVIGTTGADGIAMATLTSTNPGMSTVVVTLNNNDNWSLGVTFTPVLP
ncbi:Ig domain-containing protein [Yersinia intermedia]|uniref:Invasin n=1 Tax=Yersinia intermedia TaxID=631 RepID=A0A0H5MIG7_YERIN|nr:YrIlm family inverse autotransporter adhesin [Yersinia intermedia]CRY56901.1 Ig domain-containing protein [Yersinia intermedia]